MDFKLPEKWFVKVTEENKEVLNNWKRSKGYTDDLFAKPFLIYVMQNGSGKTADNYMEEHTELTFDEFKEHVLGEFVDRDITGNDYSYLIPLLEKLNLA